MKLKIINFLRSVRRWLSNHCGRKEAPQPAAPEPPASGPDVSDTPPCVKRIGQVLEKSGIRRRKGKTPGIWYIKFESFTDAYRLLLRLGNQEGLVCIKSGGYVRYRLNLPDNNGNITLSDRVGYRQDTLAVMLFHIAKMPEIKEIRFQSLPDRVK